MEDRAIGGFLPLDSEPSGARGGALTHWGITGSNAWMFANARSALVHLMQVAGVERVLLPAYICPALADAAATVAAVGFYGLRDDLSPDVADLSAQLRAGDCVVGVDFFGRPPDVEYRKFVAERPEILWVEDRAQAIDTGAEPWAEWQLFSPRKLFGVSDGGILLRIGGDVVPALYAEKAACREAPRRMRRDDTAETDSETWFAAYRAVEDAMTAGCEPISEGAHARLRGIDVATVIARRRANFAHLAEQLSEVGFLAETVPEFAPFGFPVWTQERDRVARRLAERRIFAARYWPCLPSESAIFPAEHRINRDLLMLPCDQRYERQHMERVVSAFREAV